MKQNKVIAIAIFFLLIILISLGIWGIFFINNEEHKISIFGIIAIISAAFTSVLTASYNHKKAKEREYDLYILKEKQKVFDCFYESFFILLNESMAKKKVGTINPKAKLAYMDFKKGLMNWGSERMINAFFIYDNKLTEGAETFSIITDGDIFLKEIRKELGFHDSSNLKVIDIILDGASRKELRNN